MSISLSGFSSFDPSVLDEPAAPPLPPEPPPPPPPPPEDSPPREPKKRKHKEKHKHKREKSSKRHRSDGESKLREKERLLARDRALLTEDPRRALPANFGGSSSAAFSYDTRGDRDNLAFECLFAGHVPSYRALLKASAAEREPPRYFRDWEHAPPPAAASASDEKSEAKRS